MDFTRRLENVRHEDSLFKSDMDACDPFGHGGINSNARTQFENTIGAYLEKDLKAVI